MKPWLATLGFLFAMALVPDVCAEKPEAEESDEPQTAAEKFEQAITGEWVLENASGMEMSPMQINKTDHDTFELVRIGGGPYAVCGEYAIEKMHRLVKVKKPGDAYWDLTWRYFNGKLVLKDGQYDGWTLRRPKKFTK